MTTEKEFEELLSTENFTIWNGYIETPVSWDPVTGDTWIGYLDPASESDQDAGQSLIDWIEENEDMLWQLFEMRDATCVS